MSKVEKHRGGERKTLPEKRERDKERQLKGREKRAEKGEKGRRGAEKGKNLTTSAEECFYNEPFVLNYYRPRLSPIGCLRSLFYAHNESANTWTQILALAVMFGCYQHASWSVFPHVDEIDRQVFQLYFFGACLCFGMSGAAHLFSCHSPRLRARMFQADYLCIFFCGFTTHVANAFFSPTFRPIIRLSAAGAGLVCLVTPLMLVWQREQQLQQEEKGIKRGKGGKGEKLRSLGFFVGMNVIFLPLYHHLGEFELLSEDFLLGFGVPFCYLIGGIFYGLFVPQRFSPGKFDLLPGQAIMHVLMLIGQFMQYLFLVRRCLEINHLSQ